MSKRRSESSGGIAGLVVGIIVAIFVILSFASALYSVNEQEVAVVTQFGRVVGTTT